MPPAGYPAFLQYLQSGRVREIEPQLRQDRRGADRGAGTCVLSGAVPCAELGLLEHVISRANSRISLFHEIDTNARPRDF